MTVNSILFLIAFGLSSVSGFAAEMPFSVKMDKLAKSVRSRPLSIEEKMSLRDVQPGDQKAYLRNKTQEFLDSNLLSQSMVYWQLEQFKLRTFFGPETLYTSGAFEEKHIEDPFTRLVAEVFSKNQSWDKLLTGTTYHLEPQQANFSFRANPFSDFDFFSLLRPNLPREGKLLARRQIDYDAKIAPTRLYFSAKDPRVAGLLSTPRFFRRFSTTDVNKNRGRASQVYRIFLCDPMFPVIPEEPDKKNRYLKYLLAQHESVTEEDLEKAIADPHGTQASCVGCHSKLDPMGRTLQGTGYVLSPFPAAGSLVIRRSSGDLQENVIGIGGLAREIVKQPEYARCQVRWFWNQFIGTDVPLSEKREQELVDDFNRLGRRTKDYIAHLVNQPEFYEEPEQGLEDSFVKVREHLKTCDSCHSDDPYMFNVVPPQFSKIFSSNLSDAEIIGWLTKMRERVSRAPGEKGKMPANWQKWPEADLQAVKSWLNKGAQDENGQLWLPEL